MYIYIYIIYIYIYIIYICITWVEFLGVRFLICGGGGERRRGGGGGDKTAPVYLILVKNTL